MVIAENDEDKLKIFRFWKSECEKVAGLIVAIVEREDGTYQHACEQCGFTMSAEASANLQRQRVHTILKEDALNHIIKFDR